MGEASVANDKVSGFTLIELSIVLVIIGLLVGGVLIGETLIRAARVRSQIAQIEEFRTVVNTFKLKYNYLPGDIPDPSASSIGLKARFNHEGQGDGSGLIAGQSGGSAGYGIVNGEAAGMWVDLSTTNLIKQGFTVENPVDTNNTAAVTYGVAAVLPEAKIGRGNYVYVTLGGMDVFSEGANKGDYKNYFTISRNLVPQAGWAVNSDPGFFPSEAFAIDSKMDDGLPQSGTVIAGYVNYAVQYYAMAWAAGGGTQGAGSGARNASPSTASTAPSSTTCFDNNSSAGSKMSYSLTSQSDALNCALSFRF